MLLMNIASLLVFFYECLWSRFHCFPLVYLPENQISLLVNSLPFKFVLIHCAAVMCITIEITVSMFLVNNQFLFSLFHPCIVVCGENSQKQNK